MFGHGHQLGHPKVSGDPEMNPELEQKQNNFSPLLRILVYNFIEKRIIEILMIQLMLTL